MSTNYYAIDSCTHCGREDIELIATTSIGWPVRLQGNGARTFGEWVEKYRGLTIRDEYGAYHEFEELMEIVQSCQRLFGERHTQQMLSDSRYTQYEFISKDGYRFVHPDRED
jgi:hypothetical protein